MAYQNGRLVGRVWLWSGSDVAWRICGVCGKLLGWRTPELHDSTKARILNTHTSQHVFNTAELPGGGAEFE
jgi:hypothetical protein